LALEATDFKSNKSYRKASQDFLTDERVEILLDAINLLSLDFNRLALFL